jgi:hypothetical protein
MITPLGSDTSGRTPTDTSGRPPTLAASRALSPARLSYDGRRRNAERETYPVTLARLLLSSE